VSRVENVAVEEARVIFKKAVLSAWLFISSSKLV